MTQAVASMPARKSMIQPNRRASRSSQSQRAASMAGRVGNISRHSISQASENSAATATTRAAVGRANHTLPSAMAANSTV